MTQAALEALWRERLGRKADVVPAAAVARHLADGEGVEELSLTKRAGGVRGLLLLTGGPVHGRVVFVDVGGHLHASLPRAGTLALAPAGWGIELVFVHPTGCLWIVPTSWWEHVGSVRFNHRNGLGEWIDAVASGWAGGARAMLAATDRRLVLVGPERLTASLPWPRVVDFAASRAQAAVLGDEETFRFRGAKAKQVAAVQRAVARRLAPAAARLARPGPPPDPALRWLVPQATLAEGETLRAIGRVNLAEGTRREPRSPRVLAVTDRRVLVIESGVTTEEIAGDAIDAAGCELGPAGDRLLFRTDGATRAVAITSGADALATARELARQGRAPLTVAAAGVPPMSSGRRVAAIYPMLGAYLLTGAAPFVALLAGLRFRTFAVVVAVVAATWTGQWVLRRLLPPRIARPASWIAGMASDLALIAIAYRAGAVVASCLFAAGLVVPYLFRPLLPVTSTSHDDPITTPPA